jgi:hypothetical protein
MVRYSPQAEEPELAISTESVCFIIVKARQFDAKEADSDPDSGSNPSDDSGRDILEDQSDDPVVEELTSFIRGLSQDDQIDLIALTWLGRDDYGADEWPAVRAEAAASYDPRRVVRYLLGMPLLSDFLAEGLALLGRSCD